MGLFVYFIKISLENNVAKKEWFNIFVIYQRVILITHLLKIERLNCFEKRLTTTHWPAPLFINRLIPCPNKYPFLEQNDISNYTLQDLSNIE